MNGRPLTVPEQLSEMNAKLDLLVEARKDQEQRIRSLERWIYGATAICGLVSVGGPLVIKAIFKI